MRVVYLTHQFFPDYYTGVERNTLNVARQMQRMGNEAVVVTALPPDPMAGKSEVRYAIAGVRVVGWRPNRTVQPMEDYVGDIQSQEFLETLLSELSPDLVHVMHPKFFPESGDVARSLGLPVITHLHDYFYVCPRITLVRADERLCTGSRAGRNCESACGLDGGTGGHRHDWARRQLESSSAVISPSEFLIEVFASEGYETSTWYRIPCGVDYNVVRYSAPEAVYEKSNSLHVGFLGTLLPHKGAHVLVEAVRRAQGADIVLRIYGSSFHEREYEKYLREIAGDDRRITFEGSYDYDHVATVLSELDVVVVPSLWYENHPISAAIAIAAGVPVVGSGTGGIGELIRKYSGGTTFTMGDSLELADILSRLASDRSLLDRIRSEMQLPPGVEEEVHQIDLVYQSVLETESPERVMDTEAVATLGS